MIAWRALTSVTPSLCSTRITPRSTTVYSVNSGVCPGSDHPGGLTMCATLAASVFELTRPTYSRICLLPGTGMTVGLGMRVGIALEIRQHFLRVAGGLDLVVDLLDLALFVDQERGALDAHVGLPVHAL